MCLPWVSAPVLTWHTEQSVSVLAELQVRGNLHLVSELINECMDYGIVTQLKQHVVLERIHSKYLPPKQSLLSLSRPSGSRSNHFRCAFVRTASQF
jgi:hypothetical protein